MPKLSYIAAMGYFSDSLEAAFERSKLTSYKVSLEAKIDQSLMHRVLKGQRKPSEEFLQKLSLVKELGLSYPELLSWKLIDEYGEDVIKEALKITDKNKGV